ncbi:hypothetical protein TOL5_43970 (plasmid) [Acinetobacter sp. Tol 5]|nr:hypothetical protein TOL5_43970 [Acinetobacter sp. Tol 5]
MEGIHLLYLEINKIFSLSCQPICNSAAECLQVAFDAGAKKVALPMSSAADIPTIPVELFTKFQTSFYADPVDAVFKGLGVD